MTLAKDRLRERKKQALEAIRSNLEFSAAAQRISVDRGTLWRWRDEDPEFAKACEDARQAAVDQLGASIYQRAMNEPDPKTGKRPYDERTAAILSMFLFKGNRPEYKDSYRAERDTPTEIHFTFQIPTPAGLLQRSAALPAHVIEGEVSGVDENPED